MTGKKKRKLTALITTLSVLVFLVISSAAVVWANGLRYNSATGTFEQTVLIAIDGDQQDVDVTLNGQLVASQIPYRARNLLPDHYTVELSKKGFQTWRQSFWLSRGQVGVITDPTLIAVSPLVTTADTNLTTLALPDLDFGLQLSSGELIDGGSLVTRLSQLPIQIHRFNGYYLYQVGNQLRLFLPAGTQDYLIYTAQTSGQLPLVFFPSTWQIGVNDSGNTKLINLTIPGSS